MLRLIVLLFAITVGCANARSGQEPTLLVKSDTSSVLFTRKMLLKMSVIHFNMHDSRAYLNQPMRYQAVKLCDILQPFHVLPTDTIELIGSDDFSTLVLAKLIMNCANHNSIGYVAIEPENAPWPDLKYNNPDDNHPKDGSAGPFAVVWTHPERSYISNEYWAWKLVTIKVHHTLNTAQYLQAPNSNNKKIINGHNAYVSRCAGCHTINHIGQGKIGPDLNSPNPTRYFESDKKLKKFIRNPQSVRRKANDRMSGTNEQFLSNKDLEDLISYLRYMG